MKSVRGTVKSLPASRWQASSSVCLLDKLYQPHLALVHWTISLVLCCDLMWIYSLGLNRKVNEMCCRTTFQCLNASSSRPRLGVIVSASPRLSRSTVWSPGTATRGRCLTRPVWSWGSTRLSSRAWVGERMPTVGWDASYTYLCIDDFYCKWICSGYIPDPFVRAFHQYTQTPK